MPEIIPLVVKKSRYVQRRSADFYRRGVFHKPSVGFDSDTLDLDEIYVFTSRKIIDADLAKERSRHMFGRFYNWLFGLETDYVEVSLERLWQLYDLIEKPRPDDRTLRGQYLLRVDIAKIVRLKLKDMVEKGEIAL